MAKALITLFEGDILDDTQQITLAELCRACNMSADQVIEWVDYGILEPEGLQLSCWRFTGVGLKRVMRASRLQRDLGLNTAGVALALDLLDEMQELRQRLYRYEASGG
ncbi:chaperone modulatory protein CbpM [Vibrio alginolyticus]|uniref:chaperone modulator CbpM n=1 Tax=Vibrio TaxID=662 RepID=UPI0003ED8DC1|nr:MULTISPECIES: chaperone modulator CbpM [Vibrio]EKF9437427.1 chaperone modulatory protein CbpM [Vibrio cholerae]TBT35780.1 MerR family transcriptional regulator [Vibrio parahaemolyticus]BCB43160.1 chaperone modulatory protein CbpM [Vibrio alginolyticus]AHI98741.1 Chaperone-modulator protein CbpM [Vibrio parahaemolyticus UCM-V493]BCB47761.1 chaperone modulatory protein CbpM [Vibrio alginolyticus]